METPSVVQRGRGRNRRTALASGIAVLARGVQVSTSLVTVPLTLKYLGVERFGLWMAISSVLAMAAFADLGVGNGVLNTVADAFGRDDAPGIRRAVSSGLAVLGSIAITVLICFFSIYSFVNWAKVFRVTSPLAMHEAGPSLMIFAICFACNIALDIVQRVQLGMQQGYMYGAWQIAGSLSAFVGILVGTYCRAGLPVLVIAIAGIPVLFTLANAVYFFGFQRPDLKPSLRLVSRQDVRQIARLGILFLVLQLAVSLAFSADNFLIARNLGAMHVPEYAVPQRMFALISMMSAMLVTPLWPAYGEAVARGDLSWVKRTLRRSLISVFVGSSALAALMLCFARPLLALWVRDRIHPQIVLLTGLAIWAVIDCCGNAIAMYFNGTSLIRFQTVVACLFGASCLLLKIVAIKKFGTVAVPWTTISTYLLFNALPSALYLPKSLRHLGQKSGGREPIAIPCAQHPPFQEVNH